MNKKIEVTIKKVTSSEPNVSARHVTYDVYHNGKYHKTFNDVNDAVDHKEKMQNEQVELDETLSVEQRRKRGQVMRAHHTKIERAREVAQRKLAAEKNLRKRAFQMARSIMRKKLAGQRGAEYAQLGPSEKVAIDRMLDDKAKAIKKLALRLMPKVKKAEYERLQSYLHGHTMQNMGAEEGHTMKEDVNELFEAAFSFPQDPNRPNLSGSPNSTMNSGLGKPRVASSGGKSKNSNIKMYKTFSGDKIAEALDRKAEQSGIDFEVLAEVFSRGLEAWNENLNVTQEQYAFARVNSFINQGKTYFNEDADLQELSVKTLQSFKDKADNRDTMLATNKIRKANKAKEFFTKSGMMTNVPPKVAASNPIKAKRQKTKPSLYDHVEIDSEDTDLNEEIKGWKNAARDITKSRRQSADAAKEVKLVRLKKNGDESKLYDATSKHADEKEAREKHNRLVQNNPGKGIAHNLYVNGKLVDTLKEDADLHEGLAVKKERMKTRSALENAWKKHVENMNKASIKKEEVELQELGPATLDSYAKKSNKEARSLVKQIGDINNKKYTGRSNYQPLNKLSSDDESQKSKLLGKLKNRKVGQTRAVAKVDRMNTEEVEVQEQKKGLWANIHAKRERIKRGSGERMKSAGEKGRPTKADLKSAQTEQVEPEIEHKNTKARKRIEKVDRAAPHTELGKQGEIITKIIEQVGNKVNDPKKRLQGTDSLRKAYQADTPGQDINESFNIAFAAGVGVTLTAADLGMRAQGGFAYHPSVIDQIEENAVTADRQPVIIPAHRDAYGNQIPAKSVLRKTSRKILDTGNTHDGEPN